MSLVLGLLIWCVLSLLLGMAIGRLIETPDEWDYHV